MPDALPASAAVRARSVTALKHALDAAGGRPPPPLAVEAARVAWIEGLELLARYGADLNACHRRYRPIHALIQGSPHAVGGCTPERLACLRWLIAHGASPECHAGWPSTRAVIVAAIVGEPAYAAVIKAGGARRDIFTAAATGDVREASRAIDADPTVANARDAGLLTPLHCAASSRLGRASESIARALIAIARQLLDAGADPNAHVRTWGHDVDVAYFAVRSGQMSMLQLLLDRGLDPGSAIAPAAWDGREDVLDLLAAHGADLRHARDRGRPLLNELIRWGQTAQARLLLGRGADPNLADERGWTALHQAIARGNAHIVADLVRAGADPGARARDGQTPRDLARTRGIALTQSRNRVIG